MQLWPEIATRSPATVVFSDRRGRWKRRSRGASYRAQAESEQACEQRGAKHAALRGGPSRGQSAARRMAIEHLLRLLGALAQREVVLLAGGELRLERGDAQRQLAVRGLQRGELRAALLQVVAELSGRDRAGAA